MLTKHYQFCEWQITLVALRETVDCQIIRDREHVTVCGRGSLKPIVVVEVE